MRQRSVKPTASNYHLCGPCQYDPPVMPLGFPDLPPAKLCTLKIFPISHPWHGQPRLRTLAIAGCSAERLRVSVCVTQTCSLSLSLSLSPSLSLRPRAVKADPQSGVAARLRPGWETQSNLELRRFVRRCAWQRSARGSSGESFGRQPHLSARSDTSLGSGTRT